MYDNVRACKQESPSNCTIQHTTIKQNCQAGMNERITDKYEKCTTGTF